jgi:hypothetical protein
MQPAVIYQHPSAPQPVLRDPRDPIVQDKYDDTLTRSVRLDVDPSPQHAAADVDPYERLAVTNGLYALIQVHGGHRVMAMVKFGINAPDGVTAAVEKYGMDRMEQWTRCMAHIAGEDI